MSGEGVLCVGFRLGALQAAERLGLAVRVLAARPIPDEVAGRVARSVEVALDDRDAVLAAGRELCAGAAPRAVVALVEGGVLPAAELREALGVPGMRPDAALCCADKIAMKRAARAAGIATAAWEPVDLATDAAGLVERLGLPLVLKRARSSGSRGQVVARDRAAVRAALARCDLAERWIEGREMSVEVFVAEGRVLFASPTEYLVPLHASIVPAALEPAVWDEARTLAVRAVAALGVERGVAHVELFLTARGPVFGEIAVRPPGGRLMQLIRRAWGFDAWAAWLALELGRKVELGARPVRVAGTWILHPGEGEVRAVLGLAAARAVPGVRALRCRVSAGAYVPPRAGSGQDVGWIDVEGASRDEVAAALLEAHARLRFRMRRGSA